MDRLLTRLRRLGKRTDSDRADTGEPVDQVTDPGPRSTPVPRLQVHNLRKEFGEEFTLSDVDFDVSADEVVALLGPSGCGKTTVLRCIAGVETPDGGEITIDRHPVYADGSAVPPEQRNVGMVYQNYAIWPHKTVYENVVFPLEHTDNEFDTTEYERRVDEVLSLLEIGDFKRSPATDLSGGQQQRTALARSLVHDPDLLLMDEPLSNLDRELRQNMRYELQQLQSELGLSILYVTHDQEEAFYLADRVLVMNDGRIVESGTPRELYRRPTSPFTRQFVGQQNRFPGTVEQTADGEYVVRTALADFPLENADYVAETVRPGPVACFVRPEEITIGRYSQSPVDILELSGTVVAEGLLGKQYEITARFDGETDLVVHTESYRPLERGDEIYVHLKPNAIQIYPLE